MSIESDRSHVYRNVPLDEASVLPDPIAQLRTWLDQAFSAGVREPNAMCLATAGHDATPSARIVLLRGLDERGLRFYTSYASRKGRELAENGRVAVTFFWADLERQVRVEGQASPISEDESDEYFATRPRGHQLSAWASEQSETIAARATLDERLAHFDARFEAGPVPRPHSWGGYRIVPARVEFWSGRPNRMHDRLVFSLDAGIWNLKRLQP